MLASQYLAKRGFKTAKPLYRYQWEGVAFLYQSCAALLADEMGLGKTIQTVVAVDLLLNEVNSINRVLIVTPASLTTNWTEEFEKWAPSLAVQRVQGSTLDREAFYLLPIPVLVGSYEQIRQDGLDRIPSKTFDLVVLDEAQRIKNRHSITALACHLLPRSRAWALSATPLENSIEDIKSILRFLDPAIKQHLPLASLTKNLKDMMLRRHKSDVRAELPPVMLQDLKLTLSESQRESYDKLWVNRAEMVKARAANGDMGTILLGIITRLKIVCNFDSSTNASSKLDALNVILERAGNKARILVFSQFVQTLQKISNGINIQHDFLTGFMPIKKRQAAIARFKSEQAPRLLLISLRAGGVGLNLGEATHVVLFDRWWNPAVELQAIYRAHRLERNEPLHVIRFLMTNSIEEDIAAILERKEKLYDEVIESVEGSTNHLTKEDMISILGLDVWD